MSAHEQSRLPPVPARFALEAGFIILVGVLAAVLHLGAVAIVVVMGLAWIVVALTERAARRPRRASRREAAAVEERLRPVPETGPRFLEPRRDADPATVSTGEWNLWELERRAREHAGAKAVPQEWAAIFRSLRPYAKSDGALPPQFDELVRESFPELTRAG